MLGGLCYQRSARATSWPPQIQGSCPLRTSPPHPRVSPCSQEKTSPEAPRRLSPPNQGGRIVHGLVAGAGGRLGGDSARCRQEEEQLAGGLPGLPPHSTTDWLAYTMQTYFFTFLEAESSPSMCRQDWFLWRPLSSLGGWPCPCLRGLSSLCASLLPLCVSRSLCTSTQSSRIRAPHPQQPHLAQSALSSSAVPTRGTGAGGSFNICIARGMDSAHNRRRPVVPGCTCRIATGGFLSTSPRVFVCSILLLQNPFFLPGYPEYTHFPKHIQAHLCQEPNSYVFSHLPSPLQWTPASVHTRASLSLKT